MKERVFFEEFESLYYFHGSSENWAMQGFHFHNQYEIILFLTDGALMEIGNRTYHVNAGDLFFINNKEYHRTSGAEGKAHNRYVLMFEPELLVNMAAAFHYDFSVFFENRPEQFIHRLHLSGEKLEKVEKLFGKIEGNINSDHKNSAESSVKLKLSILEAITAINEMYRFFIEEEKNNKGLDEKRKQEFQDPILYRERIEQLKKYIAAHVEERLDLDEISRKFYMNRYYLSHYFKKETGFTLMQYVANQKIIAAKALLKEGNSVTDVALKLSYNSDSHFIAVFKKLTGITPKKYAQSGKRNHA
ncbi:AraC family transcriptional regulator [Lacrimispora indolis]|uniref:AraC family transcriptional regulator n=1 Tax=Lacrimispora indolis TaxID=69825 RepID=UPI000411A91F|nr:MULTISPECIES: AraC family transcriptional regulator [Lachnospiraceae]MBE7720809.1 helix-turn-helix domain-containing protein [Lacrimispora celerecrescens]